MERSFKAHILKPRLKLTFGYVQRPLLFLARLSLF